MTDQKWPIKSDRSKAIGQKWSIQNNREKVTEFTENLDYYFIYYKMKQVDSEQYILFNKIDSMTSSWRHYKNLATPISAPLQHVVSVII